MARICHSLNAFSSEEPRCPEVPNAIRCSDTEGSGTSVKKADTSLGTSINIDGSARFPAEGLALITGPQMASHRQHAYRPRPEISATVKSMLQSLMRVFDLN